MSKASSSSTLPSPSHQDSPTQSPRVHVAVPQMESEAWHLTLDNLHLDNRSGVEKDAIGQHSTMKDRARAIEKLHYTAGAVLEPSAFSLVDTVSKKKLKQEQKQEQKQEHLTDENEDKDENENKKEDEKDDESDSSEEDNWGDWYASRDYAAEAGEEWDDDGTDHDSGYDSSSESDSDEDEDEDDDDAGLMIAPY